MYYYWLVVLTIVYFVEGALPIVIGALWPRYVKEFGFDPSTIGIIFAIMYFVSIGAEVSAFKIKKKIGNAYTILLGYIGCIIYIVCLAFVKNIFMVYLGVISLGIGIGLIDPTINTFAGLYYKAKEVSFMHATFCIGGTMSTLILARFLMPGRNYKLFFWYFVAIIAVSIIMLLVAKYLLKNKLVDTGETGLRIKDEKEDDSKITEIIKSKRVILALFMFFLLDGLKCIINAWFPTYLIESQNATEALGSMALSFYIASYMITRIIFGILSKYLTDKKILYIGLYIALVGYALTLLPTNNSYLIILFVSISGLGAGLLCPFLLHFIGSDFEEKEARIAVSFSGAFACIGNAFQSFFVGSLYDKVGIRFIFPYQLFIVILIIICFNVVCKRKEKILSE